MTVTDAVIIAIVEGITEFLPVSSTGHMIITEKLLGLESTPFLKTFIVAIQFGAILSVLILYWRRFLQSMNFYYKLIIAFLPAAIFGLLLNDYIDVLLDDVVVVACSLILGGMVLVFIDRWIDTPRHPAHDEITYPKALKIGLFQCIAMIPGVSRSAATIVGGMFQHLDRKTAAEFSFFLAVPTMLAATAKKLLDGYQFIDKESVSLLLIGNLVAFIVAMLAIRLFIGYISRYGFKLFGYYRIVVGVVILSLIALGYDLALV